MKTPAILLNDKIKDDSIIKQLFDGKSPNIFPVMAGEPSGDDKSFPYIRYFEIPAVQANFQRVRRDIVQYWVGDADADNLRKIIERLIHICDPDEQNPDLPVIDPSGTYKIQEVVFLGSVPQTPPSQDLGVVEQPITCTIVYTIVNKDNIWNTPSPKNKVVLVDSLLI